MNTYKIGTQVLNFFLFSRYRIYYFQVVEFYIFSLNEKNQSLMNALEQSH